MKTEKIDLLRRNLQNLGSVLVAYSGGVDSSLLLYVAHEVLGEKVIAVTAVSELMDANETREARDFAAQLGVRHLLVEVNDLDNAAFVANSPERCYHCKKYRFLQLKDLAERHGLSCVAEGSNLDDLQDYRPGHKAVAELGIKSPLREAMLTKKEIREYARQFGLHVWNKPSKPCLATRIPYGTTITRDALLRIGQAEAFLSQLLHEEQLRVREHGDLARLEIPRDIFSRATEKKTSLLIHEKLKQLGFSYIALDILGYRQGSMNENIIIDKKNTRKEG